MKAPLPDPAVVTATTRRVLAALDWRALGAIYFHEDGEAHWRAKRPQVLSLGDRLARRLLARVPRRGASLWVGAGVAELPVLLAETMLHERRVVAANLRREECDVLNAGLAAAAPELALRFVAEDACVVAGDAVFDHLGCISVFTDPETWPVVSAVAYGRMAPVQLDVTAFVAERDRARALAQALFARLVRPGTITTSVEEASWFLEQAAAVGATVDADDELVDTAVVGDPVGFLAVR